MFHNFLILIRYEILMTFRQAYSWITPLFFFIIVICLFPLALGSDPLLLHQIAPGIIWVATLLAILLALSHLFRHDAEEGFLDFMLLSPYPLTLLVFCKLLAHWITHCLPLILISPLLSFLLHLSAEETYALVITLLLGTPVLLLLGALGAALVVGVRYYGLLLPILIMPLYIPVLIFGTGTMMAAAAHHPLSGYFAILSALTLFSLAIAPWLTGIALRIGVNQ